MFALNMYVIVPSVCRDADHGLQQFREKAAFDCYKLYYSKREEAQSIFEEEYAKGSKTGFHAYIEVCTPIQKNFHV